MAENIDIDNVEATANGGSSMEETIALQALLRKKDGTPIIPFLNYATTTLEGVVKIDGTTITSNNGVICTSFQDN